MLDAILSFLPIVIAVAVLLVLLLMGYVKAPPDQAYITGVQTCALPIWPGRHQNSLLRAAG